MNLDDWTDPWTPAERHTLRQQLHEAAAYALPHVCSGCGRRLLWLLLPGGSEPVPIDPRPCADGDWRIHPGGRLQHVDRLPGQLDLVPDDAQPWFTAHWSTCPYPWPNGSWLPTIQRDVEKGVRLLERDSAVEHARTRDQHRQRQRRSRHG